MRSFASYILLCAAVRSSIAAVPGSRPLNAGQPSPTQPLMRRDDGNGPEPTLTTVTLTQDGEEVTATYSLQSISEYSGLRESINATVTTTSTVDGVAAVKTAAAVVFASGVTWLLIDFLGDFLLAESATPKEASRRKNDGTCPQPKQKCADCGGLDPLVGVCTLPPASGCACDLPSCPTEQPKCSDKTCMGVEKGKCTADSQGCDCQPDEDCPTGEDLPYCDDCGGGLRNKCKGINGKWKNCDCDYSNDNWVPPYAPNIQVPIVLPSLSDSSIGDDVGSTCFKSTLSAPQRESDGSPSVDSKFREWCSKMDGATVTKSPDGVDTLFDMYSSDKHSATFWLSASNRYFSPDYNQCDKTAKISNDECIDAFDYAMTSCDPNDGATHGASAAGQCINYNITLGADSDPNFPPWHPRPAPQCTQSPSKVQNNFFDGLYPTFCTFVNHDKNAPFSRVYTNKDYMAPTSKRSGLAGSLAARSPPVDASWYPALQFHFDWTGTKGTCGLDCYTAFSVLVGSPCGQQAAEQNIMATKASFDIGCGTYSYSIEAGENTCDGQSPSGQGCIGKDPSDDPSKDGFIDNKPNPDRSGCIGKDKGDKGC